MRTCRTNAPQTSSLFFAAAIALGFLSSLAGGARAGEVPITQRTVHNAMDLDGPRQFEAADLDGDGDLDVLVAEQIDIEFSWVENLGDGTFAAPRVLHGATTLGGEGWGIASGDFDGDGDLDVVGAFGYPLTLFDRAIVWYENLGPGANPIEWGAAQMLDTETGGAGSVRVADLDGDGDADIVVALAGDEEVVWYENTDGAGTFAASATLGTLAGLREAVLYDLDRDGDLDVIASADDTTDGVFLLENEGSVPFTAAALLADVVGAGAFDVADFTGDGWADLIVCTGDSQDACYFSAALGTGMFAAPEMIAIVDAPGDVRAFDIDGDGDPDAACTSTDDNQVLWFDNEGGGFTVRTLDASEEAPGTLGFGDIDGDGDLDPLVASFKNDDVSWYENRTPHRATTFGAARAIAESSADLADALALADLDRDGDLDAAYTARTGNITAWVPGDGAGNFSGGATLTTMTAAPASLAAADLDRDGDLDLIVGGSTDTNDLAWLENTGTGWNYGVVSSALAEVESVSAADLDRDGDADLLAAIGDSVAWFENRLGDGVNNDIDATPNVISGEMTSALMAGASDLDGDGDLDVVVAPSGRANFSYFLNDGSGGFDDGQALPGMFGAPAAVAAADLDGDGDLDLAGGTLGDALVVWWENQGGSFAAPVTLSDAATDSADVELADLDRDGNVDVVYVSQSASRIDWARNRGSDGFAAAATLASVSADLREIALGDLDGDGDLDIAATSSGETRVVWFENVGRQLSLSITDIAPASADEQSEIALLRLNLAHEGRAGDVALAPATLDLLIEDAAGALTSGEAGALIAELRVYLDTGSGSFEAGSDTLVLTEAMLTLTGGAMTLDASGALDDLSLEPAQTQVLFLAALLADTAPGTDPDHFVLGITGETVADPSTGTVLQTQVSVAVATGLVTVLNRDVSIASFMGDAVAVNEGESVTLSWETQNADSCEIGNDFDAATVAVSAGDLDSGSQMFAPPGDIAWTLTCEGDGGPVSETVSVAVNLLPVAADDSYETAIGAALEIGAANGVLANDSDADGPGALSVGSADTLSASGGLVSVAADGSFTYSPRAGFFGKDAFAYQATDGGASVTGTVRIQVGAAIVGAASPGGGGCTIARDPRAAGSLWLLALAAALCALRRRAPRKRQKSSAHPR